MRAAITMAIVLAGAGVARADEVGLDLHTGAISTPGGTRFAFIDGVSWGGEMLSGDLAIAFLDGDHSNAWGGRAGLKLRRTVGERQRTDIESGLGLMLATDTAMGALVVPDMFAGVRRRFGDRDLTGAVDVRMVITPNGPGCLFGFAMVLGRR